MSFDPQFLGNAIYILLAGAVVFMDFTTAKDDDESDSQDLPGPVADPPLGNDWADMLDGHDVPGHPPGFLELFAETSAQGPDSAATPLSLAGADADVSSAGSMQDHGSPVSIREFAGDRETLVIEFPAHLDPGELTVTRSEDGMASLIALNGVTVATVASEQAIDPDNIILQGI